MKKEHALKDVPLTVIPHYDDFEELKETKTKTSDYSGDHLLDSRVMYYIKKTQKIDEKFDFKTMKFDEEASRFYFTKQFDDPKDATEFKNKLKEFLQLLKLLQLLLQLLKASATNLKQTKWIFILMVFKSFSLVKKKT